MRAIVALLSTAAVMLVLDIAWLKTMVPALYRPKLGAMLLDKPAMGPAVAFYLLYVVGVVLLVVLPAASGEGVARALWSGAVFGLVAYATYDLTNQATLRGWSPVITAVDLVWGTALTAAAATAATALTRWLA